MRTLVNGFSDVECPKKLHLNAAIVYQGFPDCSDQLVRLMLKGMNSRIGPIGLGIPGFYFRWIAIICSKLCGQRFILCTSSKLKNNPFGPKNFGGPDSFHTGPICYRGMNFKVLFGIEHTFFADKLSHKNLNSLQQVKMHYFAICLGSCRNCGIKTM